MTSCSIFVRKTSMKNICFIALTLMATSLMSQNQELPFSEISEYSEDYTAGNTVKRFIDGLGYRYYWATEGLTEKDLKFKPSEDARSTHSTIEHIYGLSETILNAAKNEANIRPSDFSKLDFKALREGTLANLLEASQLMAGKTAKELAELKVIFKNGDNVRSSDYWHMMNGPISDAIYHVGQVVSFRRSSGNPMNPKVNVFQGKNRS